VREALEFPSREIPLRRDTARSKAAIFLSCSSAGSFESACSATSANRRTNSRFEIFFFPRMCPSAFRAAPTHLL